MSQLFSGKDNWIPAICRGREVSRPYHAKSFGKFDTSSFQEIILSSGVLRRATASGFYPWGNVDCPRERVAEGLCGWWHGNSFPTTQSAQSLRQMRSIPRCSKAVIYVFVFDSNHNSATLHNLSPGIFHWSVLIPSHYHRRKHRLNFFNFLTP